MIFCARFAFGLPARLLCNRRTTRTSAIPTLEPALALHGLAAAEQELPEAEHRLTRSKGTWGWYGTPGSARAE
jgi:hypothetical protein